LTLKLSHLAKAYGGEAVLQDCSYTFAPGDSYVLRGENGSGKSTLFRIAALLEPPDAGTVEFFDGERLLPHDLALRRRLTMVFPRVGVLQRSVFHNVAYGLKLRGIEPAAIRIRVGEMLEQVGLAPKASQPARTLSSGETMRLGLARALVLSPEILLLDEPTTHLDRASTEIMEKTLLRLRGERALTLILITHDATQAERLGERQLFLESGKLTAG